MSLQLSLSSLIVPTKETKVEVPGYPGFEVSVAFLSREEILKIRKKATTTKFDRKTRQPVEEVNDELFLELYVKSVVKGWTGFKLRYVANLLPVDLSAQKDMEAELEYTEANALALMKNSPDFDSFVSEHVSDLQNFTTASSK